MLSSTGVRRCAVLGSPVAHSLSPVLHRAAYRELGLDWRYDAVEVATDGLAGFLSGLDSTWRGLSLTMPLKRAVVPMLDEVSDIVETAGAANTVLLDDGGGRRAGHNTDVHGIGQSLRERGVSRVSTAVIVGAGATATAALLALAELGCRRMTLLVREPARAREVVETAGRLLEPPAVQVLQLDDELLSGVPAFDVMVSTVPAAAQGRWAVDLVVRSAVVFDVIYHPWPTPLARAADAAGRPLAGGLDLLVHQAARQVELMTGCDSAPLEVMRTAGRGALVGPAAGRGRGA